MSFYLIKYENAVYANDELFYTAVAGGERAFVRMLAKKEVIGKALFDQILYPVTTEQQERCSGYNPEIQDFDSAYRKMHLLTPNQVKDIREKTDTTYPGAAVITLSKLVALKLYRHRHIEFFRIQDYNNANKYKMVPKLASVLVCGRRYVALNTVNIEAEVPIVATVEE